ncbi:hypothetical protein [Mesorhizobium sp. M0276]|uniref:hypothetical protein n=1 Tax=Mesorhizobium sp. M0276 TaxID=2956928 RepID=UPI003335E40C
MPRAAKASQVVLLPLYAGHGAMAASEAPGMATLSPPLLRYDFAQPAIRPHANLYRGPTLQILNAVCERA